VNKARASAVTVVELPGDPIPPFYEIYRETARRAGFLIRVEQAYRDVYEAFVPAGRAWRHSDQPVTPQPTSVDQTDGSCDHPGDYCNAPGQDKNNVPGNNGTNPGQDKDKDKDKTDHPPGNDNNQGRDNPPNDPGPPPDKPPKDKKK
jgi:hypothetical protein